MRVIDRTADRMILYGRPCSKPWLFVLGGLFIAGVGGAIMFKAGKPNIGMWIAIAFGVFICGTMVVVGLDGVFRRERLTLDRTTKAATHETWSMLWGQRKSREYSLDKCVGTAVQRTLESSGGRRGFPIRVTKARLLFDKPRKAIDLFEVQNGSDEKPRAIAREVAEFLQLSVREIGSHATEHLGS